ncbi:FAD-dependent oxidoreductase [Aspergillus homomorphus CBS 101889]|uniref:FAD/NAD(P)-binding domain-containing protein n=1 Tax=Aspergillus homomorphus (strain CBS 101889) TaxID=1450537 RepID=A0A395IEN8_ASPHC|nr:FAD/NAD(P)-binding domain-containing protein [Aspergillus homomorphus CBS 101889]RAL16634.1 FAD/NAD(P)-binding domain-containing protein [Aspergillus homomorphus CBS 101889]
MPARILIIGAGVSGLALAQGLRRANIAFAVFERDSQLDSRLQGYRLRIPGQLQQDLQALLPEDTLRNLEATCARTEMGESNIRATDGSVLACRRFSPSPGQPVPYTVDRGLLRQALMTGIDEDVCFGKTLTEYKLVKADGVDVVEVTFQDGTVERGSLLVGADGAHSVVRRQLLPDVHLLDTDAYCIYGKSPMGHALLSQVPAHLRRWITVVRDETPVLQAIIMGEQSPVCLVAEPVRFVANDADSNTTGSGIVPENYIHWGLLFRTNRLPGTTTSEKDAMAERLRRHPADLALELTSEWHPSVRALVELQDPLLTAGMPVHSADPSVLQRGWSPSACITLMGDAIHLQSPAGGVGAFAALQDAVCLLQVISEKGISAASVGEYEQRMRQGALVCLERSFRAGEELIGAPRFEKCLPVKL